MGQPTALRAQQADIDNIFAMDEAKEQNGVNLAYGKLILSIARAGGTNKKFATLWEELARPYRRMIDAGIDLPEDVAQGLAHELFAKGIVRGWNMFNGDVEVPCTPENVIEQFKRNPEMFQFVVDESRRLSNYRKATLETESKN